MLVAEDPLVASSEIIWRSPSGEQLFAGSGFRFRNNNKQLTIQNVELTDGGIYHVSLGKNSSVSSTMQLTVFGEWCVPGVTS